MDKYLFDDDNFKRYLLMNPNDAALYNELNEEKIDGNEYVNLRIAEIESRARLWFNFGYLNDYFIDLEIENVMKHGNKGIVHPLKSIFETTHDDSGGSRGYVKANTYKGFSAASYMAENWWQAKKCIILSNDFANAAGALAEVRAYGYLMDLIRLGCTLTPHGDDSHDFTLSFSDNEKIAVEVYCKTIQKEAADILEEFYSSRHESRGSRYISVAPFGYAKKRDDTPSQRESITENVIHKIKSIKEDEKQASDDMFSILWVDLQDDSLRDLVREESAMPIRSLRSSLCSGELWYACYGKKGLPILEGDHFFNDVTMRHFGRFFEKGSRYDGIIFSMPSCTCFMENPHSEKILSPYARWMMTYLHWYRVEYSWTRWPLDDLLTRIENEHKRLEAIYDFRRNM